MRTKLLVIPHGTASGYTYHKCRCARCCAANTAQSKKWKRKNREVWNRYNADKQAEYKAARQQAEAFAEYFIGQVYEAPTPELSVAEAMIERWKTLPRKRVLVCA